MASYTLHITLRDRTTTTRAFAAPVTTIGRRNADITLDDPTVSTRHGELRFEAGTLLFVDVGSSNGSYTPDGQRIGAPLPMEVGSVLCLGDCRLQVQAIERPAPVDSDKTSMLNADQIAALMGESAAAQSARPAPVAARQPALAGASAAPAAAAPVYEPPPAQPAPRAPEPAPQASRPEPAPQASHPDPAPQAPQASRPEPRPSGPTAHDELASLDDAAFPVAFKGLILGAVHGALDLFKGWKQSPPVSFDDVKAPLVSAWSGFFPTIKESTLPLLAISGLMAVLNILAFYVNSLLGIVSLIGLVASVANLFATGAVYLYFLRRELGAPLSAIDAVKHMTKQPVPFLVSLLLAGVVGLVGFIAVLVPGMFLMAFALPVYFVEGRRNLALNRRSLFLFKQDAKRLFLIAVTAGAGFAVLSIVLGIVVGLVPFVGVILTPLVGAVLSAVFGAYAVCLMLELYFDVRARANDGDPEADARANLLD